MYNGFRFLFYAITISTFVRRVVAGNVQQPVRLRAASRVRGGGGGFVASRGGVDARKPRRKDVRGIGGAE